MRFRLNQITFQTSSAFISSRCTFSDLLSPKRWVSKRSMKFRSQRLPKCFFKGRHGEELFRRLKLENKNHEAKIYCFIILMIYTVKVTNNFSCKPESSGKAKDESSVRANHNRSSSPLTRSFLARFLWVLNNIETFVLIIIVLLFVHF